MAIVLDLEHVTVRRHPRLLLDDVSWQVADGERWVVMGPNGAGKTTLMQIAAARLHPTTGTVGLLGEEMGGVDLAELRQSIGWASGAVADLIPVQESVLDVVMTGAWAVTGRWREQYEDADLRRAEALLLDWGLDSLRQRTFGTLSEGERKRVLIARSLMADPEMLILDEPAAGLDLGGREVLVRAMSALASDPHAPTILLVTHHVEEIPIGFTHGLLLREGRVIRTGLLEEVMTDSFLSATFDVNVSVSSVNGRWTATGVVADGAASWIADV